MKKILVMFVVFVMLCGCARENEDFDKVMSLRTRMINAAGCAFDAVITADYGDKTYTFALNCQSDKDGNISFTVLEPEYISGIQGKIDYQGGKITFDDVVLAFELQTDDLLSPVSAPWIFVRALRGGYVRSCGTEDELIRATVDDSYQDDALMLDIWIDENNVPLQADIYEKNRRILSIQIKNFVLL